MKIVQSKFDVDTEYKVGTQYMTVARDGEEMRIPFRQIPSISKAFRKEIQEELMAIYDERYPIEPCPVCGKPVRRANRQIYCSVECRRKGGVKKPPLQEKMCGICGKVFTPPNGRFKYCSDKCREVAINRSNVVNGKGKRKARKDPLSLVKLNREARAKGLSYGQLQALKYIEKMREANETVF